MMEAMTATEQQQVLQALRTLREVPLDRVSKELEITYRELSGRVVELTAELEAARLERRAQHAERERLLARLAMLLDALPGGVIIVDKNGVITETNPQAEVLMGGHLDGERWAEIQTRGHFSSNGTFMVDHRRMTVTEQKLTDTGETVVLVADITEQQHLQEEAGRRTRLTALGEMAARLAHQIRTPLTSTSLYMSQLDSDIDPKRRHRICNSLREQLNHMEGLISDMLNFVRGEPAQMERIQLAEVLADAIDACDADIANSNAHVILTPVDHTLQVNGSMNELVAGVTNMIMNAIEASGSRPHIEIWAGAINENTAVIRVADRGRGIPKEIIDHIFDPFFTTRANGTGLGLAVLAATAAHHGGRVYARNNLIHQGASFTLELPMLPVEDVEVV